MLPGVEVCPVELPGHGRRLREPPLSSIAEMVVALAPALSILPSLPTVFFGHSMGAHVAHRLAFWQEQRGQKGPDWLVVSASRSPRPARPKNRWKSELPDNRFLDFLERLGGLPSAVLAERDLMELMLPVLRHDFCALESLPYETPLVVGCNISAFAATEDFAARPSRMTAWGEQTQGRFRMHEFPGGHFYLEHGRAGLISELRPILNEVADRSLT